MDEATAPLRALVTGGSTVGRLDAVRYTECIAVADYESSRGNSPVRFILDSQNPFRGTFGLRIAEGLRSIGVETALVTRTDLLDAEEHRFPAECTRGFYTFEELQNVLQQTIAEVQPDILFMAAAVSDYLPISVDGVSDAARAGKLRSDADELNVRFRRAPKLLDTLRAAAGPNATIVGFKLLVGANDDELHAEARQQMTRAHTDYCVVNDFTRITAERHPCALIGPEGLVLAMSGDKQENGRLLADAVVAKHRTKLRRGVNVAAFLLTLAVFCARPVQADDRCPRDVPHDRAQGLNPALLIPKTDVSTRKTATAKELLNWQTKNDVLLIDLRDKSAYDRSHIRGAISLPMTGRPEEVLKQLAPKCSTRIVVYCEYSLAPTRMIALTAFGSAQLRALGYTEVYQLEPIWMHDGGFELNRREADEAKSGLSFEATPAGK